MGNYFTSTWHEIQDNHAVQGKLPPSWYKLFKTLQFTDTEISKLRQVYKKIDIDHNGRLNIVELLMFLDLERTPYTERVMALFDTDNTGYVDFKEFVTAVWNYCTVNQASLYIFAFDLYDLDRTGKLTVAEIKHMLKDLYGKSYSTNRIATHLLKEIDHMSMHHRMTIEMFQEFCYRHKALLLPAFSLQQVMRNAILGVHFWEAAHVVE
mmetsp:Transcript_30923/g.51725  ORF Transcript_30923/g.51725 Transcript_30923/m.51725 type:complete len:209 (+) Transcript_30923:21-647(+)